MRGEQTHMSKPTLFFSHSSLDKDIILSLKNKLDSTTGGVIDIFMSSDGQSIPFGRNWINKIEEGLNAAQIMFVFVTENSISSGWIYFEAGYAYSKGIQVVPVGIGVDIGSLKAPLNLLQGFNITSEDSLNNFITIVNRTFDYNFSYPFIHTDYLEVINKLSIGELNTAPFENLVEKAECDIPGEQTTDGEIIKYDIDKFFNSIVKYLEDNQISFSKDETYTKTKICIVTSGVKIEYSKGIEKIDQNNNTYNTGAIISFTISPYNFLKTFSLLKDLLQLLDEKETHHLRLHLKSKYKFIINDEDSSSFFMNYPEFDIDKTYMGRYVCNELGLKFICRKIIRAKPNPIVDYMAIISFNRVDINAENIIKLIDRLYNIGLIYND